ncbi:MAG TPA: BON domain-containing protein [Acidobacteriota bacterium]|nr:BON domain-containing protein [Acidobacteriota bacterium]
MKHSRIKSIVVSAFIISSLLVPLFAQKPVIRIGTVTDGPWDRDQQIQAILETAVQNELGSTHDTQFPDDKRLSGDWTQAGVRAAMDRLLADPDVDYIITTGILSSYEATTRKYFAKPVIAARVVAPDLLNIPSKVMAGARVSGEQNLNYVTVVNVPLLPAVTIFRDLVEFDRVTFIVMDAFRQMYPDLEKTVNTVLKDMKLKKIEMIFVKEDIANVLRKISDETQAVVLSTLPHLEEAEFQELLESLRIMKLPTFTLGPRRDVERGVLFGINAKHEADLVAKRVASNLKRIVDGEEPGTIPVLLGIEENLALNHAAAAAIGFDVNAAVQRQAQAADARAAANPSMATVTGDEADLDARRSGPQLTQEEMQQRQAAIIEKVQKAIVRLPTYSVFDSLSFRVEGINKVVLLGFAFNPTTKNDAARAVERIEEVEVVENLIEVLPNSGADDNVRVQAFVRIYGHPSMRRYVPGAGFNSAEIRNFVRDLRVGLQASSLVRGSFAIHILVKNGNVALVGAVASDMDRQIAEVQANTVPGAFSVENYLQVSK